MSAPGNALRFKGQNDAANTCPSRATTGGPKYAAMAIRRNAHIQMMSGTPSVKRRNRKCRSEKDPGSEKMVVTDMRNPLGKAAQRRGDELLPNQLRPADRALRKRTQLGCELLGRHAGRHRIQIDQDRKYEQKRHASQQTSYVQGRRSDLRFDDGAGQGKCHQHVLQNEDLKNNEGLKIRKTTTQQYCRQLLSTPVSTLGLRKQI
jgi:hypothetical protein